MTIKIDLYTGNSALTEYVVPSNTTIQEFLASIGLDAHRLNFGIYSKIKPLHYVLQDGDRLEIYDDLQHDPKKTRIEKLSTSLR